MVTDEQEIPKTNPIPHLRNLRVGTRNASGTCTGSDTPETTKAAMQMNISGSTNRITQQDPRRIRKPETANTQRTNIL